MRFFSVVFIFFSFFARAEEPSKNEDTAFSSIDRRWSFTVGVGSASGGGSTVLSGAFDDEAIYNFPLGISYRIEPALSVSSGIDLQYYNISSTNTANEKARLMALGARIPVVLNFIFEPGSIPVFFELGAGVALAMPLSFSLTDAAGADQSSKDINGNPLKRGKIAIQDVFRVALGTNLSEKVRAKIELNISPILGKAAMVNTGGEDVVDLVQQGYFQAFSAVSINAAVEVLAF